MHEVTSIEDATEWFRTNNEPVKCSTPTGSAKKVCATQEAAEGFFAYMKAGPAATMEIIQFAHCGLCLKEKPANVSPRDWAKLEIGWTMHGVQVWCRRHECNVCHIDFEGRKHPANMTIHQDPSLGLNDDHA